MYAQQGCIHHECNNKQHQFVGTAGLQACGAANEFIKGKCAMPTPACLLLIKHASSHAHSTPHLPYCIEMMRHGCTKPSLQRGATSECSDQSWHSQGA
jgi:hypothetical protein